MYTAIAPSVSHVSKIIISLRGKKETSIKFIHNLLFCSTRVQVKLISLPSFNFSFSSSSHSFQPSSSTAPTHYKSSSFCSEKEQVQQRHWWMIIDSVLFKQFSSTHHDNQDSNKNCSKISEKEERMFHIVPIPEMGFLYYVLGVYYHVAHKHQQSKIQLQT